MSIKRTHLALVLLIIFEVLLGYYIIKYTLRTKEEVWLYRSDEEITCISVTSTGSFLGIGSKMGSVSLISRGKSTPLWRYDGCFGINTIKITSTGDYLAILDDNETLSLFPQTPHFTDGTIKPKWTRHLPSGKLSGIYSTGGTPSLVYVVASSDGCILLFSKNGEVLWEHRTGADSTTTTISEDGSWIFTGDSNGKVYLFKLGSSDPLWVYETGSIISSVAMSFDSKYIIVGGETEEGKGRVLLFSLKDRDIIHESYFDSPIRTVQISYNGKTAIINKRDGSAVIIHYDPNTTRMYPFKIPEEFGSTLYSPFGSFVAASNPSGEVYLYYLNRPAPLWKFSAPDEETLLALTRKGDYIFVVSSDKVYLLSNANLTEMIPGSRIGWAVFFFTGIGAAFLLIFNIWDGIKLTNPKREEYLSIFLGFLMGVTIGYLLTRDVGKSVLICSIGFSLGSYVSWREKNIISFISGCYLGCFGSGIAGVLIALFTWFGGDERNIVQLTLFHLFDGLKIGALFGPLGSMFGVLVVNLIISRTISSRS